MIQQKDKVQLIVIILLLAMSSSLMLIKGQRLAARKCDEYRQITITTDWLFPLDNYYGVSLKLVIPNCPKLAQLTVGGEEAKNGEFPHHALLGCPKEGSRGDIDFVCGGTLISDQHVMTAAHCFLQAQPTIVRLGEYDTSSVNGSEYEGDIAAIRKHPQYKNGLAYHDIALVKLASRLYFTQFIHPACLWETEERNVTNYIATGFGYNDPVDGVPSSSLMKVQLDEYPVEDCDKAFKYQRHFPRGIKGGQLCVGSKFKGRDTCQGDSGGPLQTVTNPTTCTYHVVGITSTGGACGIGNATAIYTKVSHYIDWIEDNVWGPNAL